MAVSTATRLHGLARNLAGMTFGRLTALEPTGTRAKGCGVIWRCRCDCGNESIVSSNNLASGHTKSCGCLFMDSLVTHGATIGGRATKDYGLWNQIKQRCSNPSDAAFVYYGGRGIRICERWLDFENFMADMGPRPAKHSIERIDNDGDYTPENCKWATHSEQMRNTRHNVMLTLNGESMCIAEWARKLHIPDHVLESRRRYGWTTERILTTPKAHRTPRKSAR